jgi:uncharacterized protein YecT (DUF1311 family)
MGLQEVGSVYRPKQKRAISKEEVQIQLNPAGHYETNISKAHLAAIAQIAWITVQDAEAVHAEQETCRG